MSDLHFAEPQWIHLMWLVLGFFALMLWLERRGGGDLSRFVGDVLQSRLVHSVSTGRRMLRIVMVTLACFFLTLALMRPQWGLQFISTPRVGAEIMVCLDVSKSMLAEDVAPNRLQRAKAELGDLLTYLDGDQVGLIAFAGRASVLSPLTPDFGFLRLVLDEAGPNVVGRGGTRLEEPIRKAIEGFGDTADVSRSILLITDGEDHDSFPLEAAKAAAERGIRILAIGFGDENGSEIMISDPKTGARTVLRDSEGRIAKSRLDGDMLREIALKTEGAYIPAGTGVLDLESIYDTHIASLTRGKMDGKGRSVRNDAYQLAILLALVCLIVAVASTSGSPSKRRSAVDSGRINGWLWAVVLSSLLLGQFAPQRAYAQAPQGGGTPAVISEDAEFSEDEAEQTAQQPLAEDTRTGRERHNDALASFDKSLWDEAAKDFEDARSNAGTDGELRYNASYNLAWVEVKRADSLLESDPAAALKALYVAADWFREAISLRDGAQDARHNLEVVLGRAMVLADSLEKRDPEDLLKQVNKAIEAQRQFMTELRQGVDIAASANDPAMVEQSRRGMRTLAARQLEVLAESQQLSEIAGRKLDTLKAKEESERTPEENMQVYQSEQLMYYLHRSQERMGQARQQMRRLQAERAYRRAANALTHLKRGRDQLLDPVTRIDALLADGTELFRLSSGMAALRSQGLGSQAAQQPPAWLTEDYLVETQESQEERTRELHEGLAAGLAEQGDNPDATAQQPEDPKQKRTLENLTLAEPMLGRAKSHFKNAITALNEKRMVDAVRAQSEGLKELEGARELFAELRQLIEMLYQDELRIEQTLQGANPSKNNASNKGAPASLSELLEYVPALLELQEKNQQRTPRVAELIALSLLDAQDALEQANAAPPQAAPQQMQQPAQAPADPEALQAEIERLHKANELQEQVQRDLIQVVAELKGLQPAGAGGAPQVTLNTTRSAVKDAIHSIEDLRRLFFSVIDHLKETARKQMELGDETQDVATLSETVMPAETATTLGPLAGRQAQLANISEAIADALKTQAQEMVNNPQAAAGGQQDPQQAAEMQEKMREAANLVTQAVDLMKDTTDDMNGLNAQYNEAVKSNSSPASTAGSFQRVQDQQTQTLEKLAQAISLLQPPQQQQDQQEDQQQEQQQQEQEQQAQEGEQQPEQRGDVDQMMQGIRDREAQRRDDQEEKHRQGYEPVEKDW